MTPSTQTSAPEFKAGCRIRHRVSGKVGMYWGLIRHTYKHKGLQEVRVRFDGNKYSSRVPQLFLEVILDSPHA